jgi:hypothetical protein
MHQPAADIETRTEELGAAILADPQAFAAALQGTAQAMREADENPALVAALGTVADNASIVTDWMG